jgi:hypothetical protein
MQCRNCGTEIADKLICIDAERRLRRPNTPHVPARSGSSSTILIVTVIVLLLVLIAFFLLH